jgi:thiamine biosynthesis lipoprotein
MKRRRFLTLAAAFACAPRLAHAMTWRGRALGADMSVTLHGPREETAAALAAIPTHLAEVERLFSLYDPDSLLSRLNERGRLDAPPPAFVALMSAADRAHRLTDGRFDPTVQPLWQALAKNANPDPARAAIGWGRIRQRDPIRLGAGQRLTFNGIAQGFATDRVRKDLQARGFTHALVDLGEQAALGGPFRLGLHDPAAGFLGQRTLQGNAIATSSPGALRLGKATHILSPGGEAPRWSTLSVEAAEATLADALSTAAVFMDRARLARLKRDAGLIRITAVDHDGRLISL